MGKLKEWIEWNFGTFSIKKTLPGVIFLVIISSVLIILLVPDNSKNKKAKRYSGETTGIVYEITPKKIMAQTTTGTEQTTTGYVVKFRYTVNSKEYEQQEYILNKNSNYNLIKLIYNNLGKDNFTIRYLPSDPKKSTILFKIP